MNKNSAKRFLSIVIVLSMLMTNIILATSAFGCAGAVDIIAPVEYTVRGELVENGTVLEVVIEMSNNTTGLWAGVFGVTFNPDAIKPVEPIESGNAWDMDISSFDSFVNYDKVEYDWLKNRVYLEFMTYDDSILGCQSESGVLATLRFMVVDPYADYGIEFSTWANTDNPEGDPDNHLYVDFETLEFIAVPMKVSYALPDIPLPPDTEYVEPEESEPIETTPIETAPNETEPNESELETTNPVESETTSDEWFETEAPMWDVVYNVIGEVSEDGRYLDVAINMDNNVSGLWNATMFLKYDENVLKPVEDSIENGDVWSYKTATIDFAVIGSDHVYEWARNSVYFDFAGKNVKNVATAFSGTVVTLRFEIVGDSDDLDMEFNVWCANEEYYTELDFHSFIDGGELHGKSFVVEYDLPAVKAPEKPVETEPVETEPVVTDSVVTDPVVTEPEETKPAETEPAETAPEVVEPVAYSVTGKVSEDGKYLDLTINMDNNKSGLWAAMLYLTYDAKTLKPVADSIENGNVWSYKNATVELDFIEDHPYEWAKKSVYLNFSGNNLANATTKVSGTLVTMSFEIVGTSDDLGIELKPWVASHEYTYEFINHVTYNTSKEELEEVPFTVYYELPSVSAPDTEPVVPDTSAPDTAPDTSAPDTAPVVPDTTAPDTAPVVPDTTAPDTAPVEPEDTTVPADAVVYNVEAKKLNCGSVMEVTIKMENNSGLWSSIFALKYNPEALKIEYDPDYEPEDENDPPSSIENGNVWSYRTATIDYGVIGVDHPYEWAHNSVYISYTGNDDKNAATKAGGTLVKIRFEVLDPEADPEFELILWCADKDYYKEKDNHATYDSNLNTLVGVPFGVRYEVDLSSAGHQIETSPAVAPTCTEDGLESGEYCKLCGEIFVAQTVIPALGHVDEILPASEPTCTEKGYSEGLKCSVCDKILKGQIVYLPLGHTEEEIPAVAATCLEAGLTAGAKCSVCEEILVAQKVVDALGHTEVADEAVAPTCTESGLTAGTHCDLCSEILVAQEVVDALGHTEVADEAVAPTCTESGLTAGSHCEVCGETIVAQGVMEALGHTEIADEAVAPTCTESGLTAGSHCEVCGEIFVAQEAVEALGHITGEWITEKEATEEETGLKVKKCETCGEILEEEEIPKIVVYFDVIINGESVKYKVGETVTISTDKLQYDEVLCKAYIFESWTVEGVTVEDTGALEISFVMPRCDVVITENTFLHGDVNEDGKITASDILALLVAMKSGDTALVCDVTLDGKVTAADKLALSQIQKGTYVYN